MKKIVPYILLILFGILLLSGIFLGEVSKVLHHATTLCLDCIGIG